MLLRFISSYPLESLLLYFLFSNLVGAMPKPQKDDCFYAYFYRFAHGFAGNVIYAARSRFGNDLAPSN